MMFHPLNAFVVMRRRGDKTYRYGYLDKVLSVTEGEQKYTYDYHVDGQLARADYGNGKAEDFGWDGLALIKRGDERFVNEPHVGGGNPVASSKGTTYFNDILGTTVGAKSGKYGKYTAAALTAFGETIENVSLHSPTPTHNSNSFYTGKPEVAGLGRVFLFRNYRASLAKWQTADPIGYPDGWNQLAYCGNGAADSLDYLGTSEIGDAAGAYMDFLKTSRDLIDLEDSYTRSEQDRLKRFGGNLRIDLDSWGTFDVNKTGNETDKGNPYWDGSHWWQPTERVDTIYTYRAYLVFVVGPANEVSAFIAGATSAIPTTWWMGLVETIAGAFIPTETRQVIGFEFTLLKTSKQTEFSRRLLE